MNSVPQGVTSTAGPAAAGPLTTADLQTRSDPSAATAPLPSTAKAVAYALLWVAIPAAALVIWAMATASASATGGCGGG
jgi:hypothetical protein